MEEDRFSLMQALDLYSTGKDLQGISFFRAGAFITRRNDSVAKGKGSRIRAGRRPSGISWRMSGMGP